MPSQSLSTFSRATQDDFLAGAGIYLRAASMLHILPLSREHPSSRHTKGLAEARSCEACLSGAASRRGAFVRWRCYPRGVRAGIWPIRAKAPFASHPSLPISLFPDAGRLSLMAYPALGA